MKLSLKAKLVCTLIVVTFFAYFSSLGNPFIWDDYDFIVNNVYIQHFDVGKIFTTNTVAGVGLISNYYRPLTSLSFAIDAKIWGQNTFGFHLTNIFLHICAGVLLFLLLGELGIDTFVAFFITLIFLLHPLQPEAVTYMNSRGDPLYAALISLSFLLFVIAAKRQSFRAKLFGLRINFSPNILLIFSTCIYFLSILAKETALSGFLLFLPIYFLHIKKITYKIPRNLWVFVTSTSIIALAYFVSRLTILNFSNLLNNAPQSIYSSSLLIRFFAFCKAWILYMTWIIFPYNLHYERNYDIVGGFFTSFSSPYFVCTAALFMIFVAICIYFYIVRKNLLPFFGLFWMFVFLIPVSGIIPVNGIVYQHWLYMPLVGFSLMIVSFAIWLWGRIGNLKYLFAIGMVIAGIFFVMTIQQNTVWSDAIGFYTYNLQFTPNSDRLHDNLGGEYGQRGELQKELAEYIKAAKLNPASDYFMNIGLTETTLKNYPEAEKNYLKALSLDPSNVKVEANLLRLYLRMNEPEKGLPILKQYEPVMKNNAEFQRDYGIFLWLTGDKRNAEKYFAQALYLSHNSPLMQKIIQQVKSGTFLH